MIDTLWRGIEVVITGLTRNQFASNRTGVRIPPSPPEREEMELRSISFFVFSILFDSSNLRSHPFVLV